jgi:hypothetical protein
MQWFKLSKNVWKSDLQRVEARITSLEAEILDLTTAIAIIRNKVLRKIQFKQSEDQEQPEELNSQRFSDVLPKDDYMGHRGK